MTRERTTSPSAATGGARVSSGASPAARRAAIRHSRAAYFQLACGHYTDRAEQETWSAWKPGRGKYFCEACSRWLRAKPRPLPQEPLF